MTARRPPPRYVPTLTEVVRPNATPAAGAAPAPAIDEEELVRRVLQRLDAVLETRLRECVAAIVAQQTQSLAPLLRAEVEASVRQAVADALAPPVPPVGEH